MNAIQNRPFETTIVLIGFYGVPLSGVDAVDLRLRVRKTGDSSLRTFDPLPADWWQEIGNGYYILTIPAELMDVVGTFFYELSGAEIPPTYNEISIVPPPLPAVRPDRCVVTGTITDVAGEPVILGPRIVFRLLDAPLVIDGVFVQGGHYETRADAYGNFSVSLVRGVRVSVEIELLAVKHVIVVPDQDTARLVDLLPALP